MNRICLKRKDTAKKNASTVPAPQSNQNTCPPELEDLSNSQVSKTTSQNPKNDQNHRVFEEFQIQYDTLRKQHEELRKCYDDTVREKKRTEIQLMNANPEYYQKEINRLRAEVEKLQEENQDYKHKYFVGENSKKQMQSTIKVKGQEVKRCLQHLEKQKISVVELKHQLNEKQKFYQRMVSEMEKSTQVLSTSFEDVNKKLAKAETQLKTRENQYKELQRNYEGLCRQNAENESLMRKNKEIFDQTNFKKTQKIDELETKLRGLDRTSRDTIEELQLKIEEFSNYRKTENLFMNERIQSASSMKILRQNQLEVVRLQEINKELRNDLENQKKLVQKLEEKLLNWYSPDQYKEVEQKLEELEQNRYDSDKHYEERILAIQKENEMLRMDSLRNPAIESNENHEFQQLLKNQVEENTKMRRQLSSKVDELYNVKMEMEELKGRIKNSQDEVNLLNKKIKSQQKNSKIQTEVSSQHLKNEIDSLKRKLETTNHKLEGKIKEVKEKESFIINTIIGRSRQEDVPFIFSELQRIFEAEYSNKLSAALEKISTLEKKA